MNFERNHLKYIKSQKVLSSAYLRLDSVEENIEGDANLHHTPPPRNRVKGFSTFTSKNAKHICENT